MNNQEILSHIDHTLLKPFSTWDQIKVICDDAVENQ
ncbi:MAG: 2-deoxyribose-5-phosphate aldolase, partial [Eubacterium sp.]